VAAYIFCGINAKCYTQKSLLRSFYPSYAIQLRSRLGESQGKTNRSANCNNTHTTKKRSWVEDPTTVSSMRIMVSSSGPPSVSLSVSLTFRSLMKIVNFSFSIYHQAYTPRESNPLRFSTIPKVSNNAQPSIQFSRKCPHLPVSLCSIPEKRLR